MKSNDESFSRGNNINIRYSKLGLFLILLFKGSLYIFEIFCSLDTYIYWNIYL